MAHFYFPIHEQEILGPSQGVGRNLMVSHRNHPINLDQVVTFLPGLERYDFRSAERYVEAPVPAIQFFAPGAIKYNWLFGDEMSRDAELRALVKHLGGGAG
jgi:hypothetical protein